MTIVARLASEKWRKSFLDHANGFQTCLQHYDNRTRILTWSYDALIEFGGRTKSKCEIFAKVTLETTFFGKIALKMLEKMLFGG